MNHSIIFGIMVSCVCCSSVFAEPDQDAAFSLYYGDLTPAAGTDSSGAKATEKATEPFAWGDFTWLSGNDR
jgi:hypothetical protein